MFITVTAVEQTDYDNTIKVVINPTQIATMTQDNTSPFAEWPRWDTRIQLQNGDTLLVRHTPEEIQQMIPKCYMSLVESLLPDLDNLIAKIEGK